MSVSFRRLFYCEIFNLAGIEGRSSGKAARDRTIPSSNGVRAEIAVNDPEWLFWIHRIDLNQMGFFGNDGMEPRISLITLGVADLTRSLRFYRDGLGFPTTWTGDKGIVFLKTTGTCLALYPYDELAKDVSDDFLIEKPRFGGITLAHNVRQKDEVDRILKTAEQAGGKIEKPAQDASWGGYSGYFSDPDGYLWEVAWGAFPIREDGSLEIP